MANKRRDSNRWIGIAIKGIARGEEGGQAKEGVRNGLLPISSKTVAPGHAASQLIVLQLDPSGQYPGAKTAYHGFLKSTRYGSGAYLESALSLETPLQNNLRHF